MVQMRTLCLLLLLWISDISLQAQVIVPAPSPFASVTTVVGLTDVKVEYSRPKAKGRKIFGSTSEHVVPFGKIWRTAANNGTKVTFSDDVKLGNADLPKGVYLLLTIPNEKEWTIIIYKDVSMGGDLESYDQTKDQARLSVKSDRLTERVETFTIEISDLSETGKTANLQLMWENTSVKIPITADFDAKVMRSIDTNTKIVPNNLVLAATYYLENGKDLKQALSWINTALESNPEAFWMLYHKARIQKAFNDRAGALATSKASWESARKNDREDFQRMNEDLQKSLK